MAHRAVLVKVVEQRGLSTNAAEAACERHVTTLIYAVEQRAMSRQHMNGTWQCWYMLLHVSSNAAEAACKWHTRQYCYMLLKREQSQQMQQRQHVDSTWQYLYMLLNKELGSPVQFMTSHQIDA